MDSGGAAGSDAISITVDSVPNTAPTVTITAPVNGSTYMEGNLISFAGAATDAEDGVISANLSWSSTIDGSIGAGASFTSALSAGTHTITASVMDSGGAAGSDAISLNIGVDNLAISESTARGTVGTGTSFEDTWVQDNVYYEILTEEQQGGNQARSRSLLDHTWTLDVAVGAHYVFKVDAYHTGTEDNFVFSYSRDNSVFTPMVIVNKTVDDDLEQAYVFLEDVSGTVYVRVQDTDNTRGNWQLDSLLVDSIVIATMMGGGNATAPVVTIDAPSDGATFTAESSVSFSASANDAEDGVLDAALSWVSSINGTIGSGAAFSTSALSLGEHTVTASVTDSGDLLGADSITITVISGGNITLSAIAYKVKGVHHADLTWSGATSSVNIIRDGVDVGTDVPNSGAYTDNIGSKGSGSYLYEVCEYGGGACSDPVSVTF